MKPSDLMQLHHAVEYNVFEDITSSTWTLIKFGVMVTGVICIMPLVLTLAAGRELSRMVRW